MAEVLCLWQARMPPHSMIIIVITERRLTKPNHGDTRNSILFLREDVQARSYCTSEDEAVYHAFNKTDEETCRVHTGKTGI